LGDELGVQVGFDRFRAAFGAIAAFALVLMKFLPIAPGHFTIAEYIALGVWLGLGAILHALRPGV